MLALQTYLDGPKDEHSDTFWQVDFRQVGKVNIAPQAFGGNVQYEYFLVEFLSSPPPKTLGGFEIADREVAERLGNAVAHAVELCGGGDNDPFKSTTQAPPTSGSPQMVAPNPGAQLQQPTAQSSDSQQLQTQQDHHDAQAQ